MPFLDSKEKIQQNENVEIHDSCQKLNLRSLETSFNPSIHGVDTRIGRKKKSSPSNQQNNGDDRNEDEDKSEEETCIDDVSLDDKEDEFYGDARETSRNSGNDNNDGMQRLQGAALSIPGLEETFEELKSVQNLLEGLQGKPPRSRCRREAHKKDCDKEKITKHSSQSDPHRDSKNITYMPLTVENIRCIKDEYKDKDNNNGRLSRLSNTNRTESDLDLFSEYRDDLSTDSNLYADDEGGDDDDDIDNDPYTTADDELDASLDDADLESFVVGYTFYNSKTYQQQEPSTDVAVSLQSVSSVSSCPSNTQPTLIFGNSRNQIGSERIVSSDAYTNALSISENQSLIQSLSATTDDDFINSVIINNSEDRTTGSGTITLTNSTNQNGAITITNTSQRPTNLSFSSYSNLTSTSAVTHTISSPSSTSRNNNENGNNAGQNRANNNNSNSSRNTIYSRSNSDPGAFAGRQLSISTINFQDDNAQGLNSDEELWAGRGAAFNSWRSYHAEHAEQPQQGPGHSQRLQHFHSAPGSTDAAAASGEVSNTFQNAREQMMDIQQHLQALRRQMEGLEEELSSTTSTSYTLTPDFSAYDSK